MLVSSPIIDEYVKSILYGKFTEPHEMRDDLANEYQADKTCPVTTGDFSKMFSEAAYEDFQINRNIDDITEFWRVVSPSSKLAT